MRVISGKYKGKNIMGFDISGTRPTMDRVKESMFGMIQNNLKNSICLDLFAGSGSLGIEALSNGASKCYFIENSNLIFDILKNNLNGISNSELIKKDYKEALNFFVKEKIKFDIIFLDPPYKLNLINDILRFVSEKDLLNPNGLIVCEFEDEVIECFDFELIKTKKYGSKHVSIYRKF